MKKVIVTGGSRGIGAAIVRKFTQNGDKAVFIYRSSDCEAKKLADETGAYAVKADMSDAKASRIAVAQAIEMLGGVDVLVNCAGISQIKLFTEITDSDWKNMIDTNLSGAFYASREAASEMIKNQHGKIINIGSMWGRCGASCEVHYSAAKAGLRGMTMALAKELGPSGITVNCIEPGVIDTDMNKDIDADAMNALIEATPMCRIGTPEDIAAAVAFFASDGASFITAQCIGVDGGFIS